MTYLEMGAVRHLASLERYDQQRSEDHVVDKLLPEDPGVVHANPNSGAKVKRGHPRFADRHEVWHALCGRRVKVLLPRAFDSTDPSACPRCAAMEAAGA